MSPKPTLTVSGDTNINNGTKPVTKNVSRNSIRNATNDAVEVYSLEAFRQAGITSVVSLLEAQEVSKAGLSSEPTVAKKLGITFTAFPIKDYGLPVSDASYLTFVRELWQRIHRGEQVLVHCYGGIGRSGMVVAGILIYDGFTPEEAFAYVSNKRKHSVPDTAEQKQWVTNLHQSLVDLRLN